MPPASLPDDALIEATRQWVVKAVIGLNLCPFAKAEHVHGRIRYAVSHARSRAALQADLRSELSLLAGSDSSKIETTLVIVPGMLGEFLEFNDFLDEADAVVEALELAGVLQIASFHPHYQFADARPDDIENFTNRSPWPTLHLIREESLDRAVQAFPDAADIYERNIAVLRQLGHEGWKKLWS